MALGLPLGLEAPVMTPNGVIFLFFLCIGWHPGRDDGCKDAAAAAAADVIGSPVSRIREIIAVE